MRQLTEEDVLMAMSSNGGWSAAQLKLIGVEWPPEKGWKTRAVGAEFDQSTIESFIGLKDKHLE